jgi:hypothetical protein
MQFGEQGISSTLKYNYTEIISPSNHSTMTRLKQQEIQQKTKKKKARFFEQFCKYISYMHTHIICI